MKYNVFKNEDVDQFPVVLYQLVPFSLNIDTNSTRFCDQIFFMSYKFLSKNFLAGVWQLVLSEQFINKI